MFSQKCIYLWRPKRWQKVIEVEAWPCCVLLKLYFIFWRLHLLRECQVSSPCFVSAANSLYYQRIFHFICQQIQASNTTQEIYLIFIHRHQRIIWITWFPSFYVKVNSIHCFQKIPICHNMSPISRLLFIHSHRIFCTLHWMVHTKGRYFSLCLKFPCLCCLLLAQGAWFLGSKINWGTNLTKGKAMDWS